MATTTATPWQAQILEELDDLTLNEELPEEHTHAAVFVHNDDDHSAMLLGTAENEIAAVVIAEDKGAQFNASDGEARVVKLDDLAKWSADRANDIPDALRATVDGPTIEPRRQNVEPDGEPDEGEKIPNPPGDGDFDTGEGHPDTKEPEQPIVEDDGQTTAFNKDGYIPEPLQLPKVDGEGIDKIGAKFGGLVRLDRSQAPDCAIVRDLKLGSTVTLMVECEVGPPVPGYTTNKDGDLDALQLVRQFKVISVYRPAAEEL